MGTQSLSLDFLLFPPQGLGEGQRGRSGVAHWLADGEVRP